MSKVTLLTQMCRFNVVENGTVVNKYAALEYCAANAFNPDGSDKICAVSILVREFNVANNVLVEELDEFSTFKRNLEEYFEAGKYSVTKFMVFDAPGSQEEIVATLSAKNVYEIRDYVNDLYSNTHQIGSIFFYTYSKYPAINKVSYRLFTTTEKAILAINKEIQKISAF